MLYNLFVACALIFNQYANPIAITAIKWKYYIVYDVWLLFEVLVVYFLFVETSGSSLEEMAAVIDGEEAREHIIEGVARASDKHAMMMQGEGAAAAAPAVDEKTVTPVERAV